MSADAIPEKDVEQGGEELNDAAADEDAGADGEEVAEGEEAEEAEEEEGEGEEAVEDEDVVFTTTAVDEEEGEKKITDGTDINTQSFDELHVEEKGIQAANDCWRLFISTAESREAAGEVIYAALFESAPSLQSLFVTPRAVQAMKFMNGIASFCTSLDNPPALKILVETLGFGHLHLDVTVPRVVIFRDAILDIFAVELAEKFTSVARDAWTKLLNYVGGAIIFVKANYADRINTLLESWKIATDGKSNSKILTSAEMADDMQNQEAASAKQAQDKKGWFQNKKGEAGGDGADGTKGEGAAGKELAGNSGSANQVPTTYNEMFKFNSAVMGFGTSAWMDEVLSCFHNIVSNVSNSGRLQEECDVLVLRISKVARGNVNFGEYKSCMLASLRSLLPKDWSTQHEVSWSWLWENVERLIVTNMGKPAKWEKALAKLLGSLDENQSFEIRKEIYARFFAAAPAGQDYFKQSNTYLHFIADRVLNMTLELLQTPVKMVDDISALGLRHVGYAIPTEFFGPFVSACCEVIMTVTQDPDCIEAFRWSLGLVSKMLVRTITEGSTIVMKAINTNNMKQLKKAISCAPRGERMSWLLIVQVGTQSISPLAWSVESGALEAAGAIIADLLTFRADRDRYYYGMDALFKRHPDIISNLANNAPTLLPKLLDGLIWRARTTENGLRRANYYFKHLLQDENGKFSPTLSWIAKTNDPRLVIHPVLVLLSDTIWSRVACRTFLFRKSWFLLTLIIYIAGQSILKHLHDGDKTQEEEYMVFGFRCFIFLCSMPQLLYTHLTKCFRAFRAGEVIRLGGIPIPAYLKNWQDSCGFALLTTLILMLIQEPILWCLGNDNGHQFYDMCPQADDVQFSYSIFSMIAMVLYFALLIDLAVLSTKVSAYVLVCIRMISEVCLFLLALVAFLLAFSSSISVVQHEQKDFEGIHKGMLALLEMTMKMYDGAHYEMYESDPLPLVVVFVFLICIVVFLLNMLVAQLTCAYEAVYVDMVGYARLERVSIIVGVMPAVSQRRWRSFMDVLQLDAKTEFNAGDVGVTGGLQVFEPSNQNPTTTDMIKRFGGSTSVEMQWPADDEGEGDEADKFERLEGMIQKTLKRLAKGGSGGSKGRSGGSTGMSGSNSDSKDKEGSSGHSASEEAEE